MLLVTSADNARYWHTLLLLGVGALIKSPVAFVFLAFYVTWMLVNRHSTLSSRRSWLRLGGLLVASLSAAFSAEWFRRAVSQRGDPMVEEGFSPHWYFGMPGDRISFHTWKMAAYYFKTAFPFEWVAFAAMIAVAVYVIRRRIDGIRLLLPLFVGFISGWLVFTPPYVENDYYSLPATFMLLTAVSIAVRDIASRISEGDELPTNVVVILVLVVPFMTAYGYKTSGYGVMSEGQTMRFVLRDVEHFVYVSDEEEWSPVVGGLAAKPFTTITPSEFQKSCAEILQRAQAVVIWRRLHSETASQCITTARESAESFIAGPDYQVFLLGN
jgi:hypothetical protein